MYIIFRLGREFDDDTQDADELVDNFFVKAFKRIIRSEGLHVAKLLYLVPLYSSSIMTSKTYRDLLSHCHSGLIPG